MSDQQVQTGGCHCGKVRWRVRGDMRKALACNCSICSKTGTLLSFVPIDRFELLQGGEALTDYQFNKKVIHHYFCSTCGLRSFARGAGPDGKEMAAVNVRCIDGFDLAQVEVQHYDGKSA